MRRQGGGESAEGVEDAEDAEGAEGGEVRSRDAHPHGVQKLTD